MELSVNLGPRSYPIVLDQNISAHFPGRLSNLFPNSRFALVTNTTIRSIYGKLLKQWEKKLDFELHVMPDGEQYKTVKTWSRLLDTLLSGRFERSGVIIAFGGGVVGDIAGFAAASLLRGVRYVQVPTTLLAMVDSSVGGKTGVDHPCGKNLIGAFHQPSMVWVDTSFLRTLPKRQYLAGYAELFKYAFIGGRSMFDFVSANHSALEKGCMPALLEGIKRSIEIKAAVVGKDERESTGQRMLLNFGHTFAHALENHFGYKKILHGEAVWWGMRCAGELGKTLKTMTARSFPLYDYLLRAMPLPSLPSIPAPGKLYEAMRFDKKVARGKIRFVVPAAPGTSIVAEDVTPEVVKRVLASVFSPV